MRPSACRARRTSRSRASTASPSGSRWSSGRVFSVMFAQSSRRSEHSSARGRMNRSDCPPRRSEAARRRPRRLRRRRGPASASTTATPSSTTTASASRDDRRVLVGVDRGDEAGALDAPEEGRRAGGPATMHNGGGRARAGDADEPVHRRPGVHGDRPGDAEGGAHAPAAAAAMRSTPLAAPGAAAGDDEEPRRLQVARRGRLQRARRPRAAPAARSHRSSAPPVSATMRAPPAARRRASYQPASSVTHQGAGRARSAR